MQTAQKVNNHPTRYLVSVDANGRETVEQLGSDGLVFRNLDHLLSALVSGSMGERITQTIASQACLLMASASTQQFTATHQPLVRQTLQSIKQLSPAELHELATGAYRELCVMAHRGNDSNHARPVE